eukprot:scaffold309611_cov36-Tisochrysis_lutea.AAC.4
MGYPHALHSCAGKHCAQEATMISRPTPQYWQSLELGVVVLSPWLRKLWHGEANGVGGDQLRHLCGIIGKVPGSTASQKIGQGNKSCNGGGRLATTRVSASGQIGVAQDRSGCSDRNTAAGLNVTSEGEGWKDEQASEEREVVKGLVVPSPINKIEPAAVWGGVVADVDSWTPGPAHLLISSPRESNEFKNKINQSRLHSGGGSGAEGTMGLKTRSWGVGCNSRGGSTESSHLNHCASPHCGMSLTTPKRQGEGPSREILNARREAGKHALRGAHHWEKMKSCPSGELSWSKVYRTCDSSKMVGRD